MIAAIIQARMSSNRLPGKTLASIAGQPMLGHVIERARRIPGLDQVIVATTTDSADDAVASYVGGLGIPVYRGSQTDVLDRFYKAAKESGVSVIIRVTSDCPLLDAGVSGEVLDRFRGSGGSLDYVSNVHPPTFPNGLDTEVFSFAALERAWREAKLPSEREHVTPYMWKHPAKFRLANVTGRSDLSSYRWTVDEAPDLELIRAIYEAIGDRPDFLTDDILRLLEGQPELMALNQGITKNEGYYRTLYGQARGHSASPLKLTESQRLFERAAKVIPGASQTFSKSSFQFVGGVSPLFLRRGHGCRVWDVDDNEYIDNIQGLLPNILGYAHPEVTRAVADQCAEGHSFSLPHPLETELAERLVQIIPCAEMIRFGLNGSDATSGAVRVARAFTERDRIACCGYHGWQDWYVGSTTRNAGVPGAVQGLTHTFPYNDSNALEALLGRHPEEFAVVILEPFNFVEPDPGYLDEVRDITHRHGALLVFDEICTGFHFGLGGAQRQYGVTPDLACFGKAMGNGFPISCVAGRSEVMRLFEEVFFSFTFAGALSGIVASMKVIDILESTDALARMEANGKRLQDGFNTLARLAGLDDRFDCVGRPQWSLMRFRNSSGAHSLLERSLFQQEAVKRGILTLTTHNLTAAHDEASIEEILEAYAEVFKTLAAWLGDENPARFLEGSMIEPVFRVR